MTIISSDHPLSAEHRAVLAPLLDQIIPADVSRSLPAASDVGVSEHLRSLTEVTLSEIRKGLDEIAQFAKDLHGQSFESLPADAQEALVVEIRAQKPGFGNTLAIEATRCYYRDDRVLEAVGMPARPPFPQGYEVPAGDLSLLDPVRERGPVWRHVPEG